MGDNIPDRASVASKELVQSLHSSLSMNKLVEVIIEYQRDVAPKEYLPYEEFDYLFVSMINNPARLFEFFRTGHNANVLEVFIALIIFCPEAEYDDRIQLVFNLFDIDGGGSLDRKETSKLLQSTINGLTKLADIPPPNKTTVGHYITEVFYEVDEDGSGVVEYDELKDFVDNNMEMQEFMLRYSRVQTYIRAKFIYDQEKLKWKDFFVEHAIDYFGDLFIEVGRLEAALNKEIDHVPKVVRKRLMYIFTNEGQNLVSQPEFLRIMNFWSAFTANDINRDNELDSREVKMLMWLEKNAKPSKALIEKEVKYMDQDNSGTLNRIEWVAYLAAPSVSLYHIGNRDYYDFAMRELFEAIDEDRSGGIDFDELLYFVRQDLGSSYLNLSKSR